MSMPHCGHLLNLAAQTRQNRCLQDAGNISKLSRELTNFHDVYTHPQQSMPVSVGRAMQMLQIGTASSALLSCPLSPLVVKHETGPFRSSSLPADSIGESHAGTRSL